jgi:hypothetical protein
MVFFFLILRYKKMATDGGGGVVDGRARPLTEGAGWWMAERGH